MSEVRELFGQVRVQLHVQDLTCAEPDDVVGATRAVRCHEARPRILEPPGITTRRADTLLELARERVGQVAPVGRRPGLGCRAVFPRRGVSRRRIGAAVIVLRRHHRG